MVTTVYDTRSILEKSARPPRKHFVYSRRQRPHFFFVSLLSIFLYVYILCVWLASRRGLPSAHKAIVQLPFVQAPNLLVFVPFLGSHKRGSTDTIFRERLAFKAWENIAHKAKAQNASFRLLGLVESVSQCDIFASASEANSFSFFSCVSLPSRCLHQNYDNLPMINCLFDIAKAQARPEELLLYSNGDIIFAADLLGALSSAVQQALLARESKFVMVGRRTDVSLSSMFWSHGALDQLILTARRIGTLHQDSGVDYFAFSQNVFPLSFPSLIPPFLVGRYRWDNALLASILLDSEVLTIDMTACVLAVHPNVHDSDANDHLQRLGALYNEQLAHRNYGYGYTLGRIDNTDWVHKLVMAHPGRCEAMSRKNKPDNDLLRAIGTAKLMKKINTSGKQHFPRFLLLITVAQHEISVAVDWARRNAQRMGEQPGFLFLTADEDTYLELSLYIPNGVLLDGKASQTVFAGVARPSSWDTFDRLLHYHVTVAIIGVSRAVECDSEKEGKEYFLHQLVDLMTAGSCEIIVSDMENGDEGLLAIKPTSTAMFFWNQYKHCEDLFPLIRGVPKSHPFNYSLCSLCAKK